MMSNVIMKAFGIDIYPIRSVTVEYDLDNILRACTSGKPCGVSIVAHDAPSDLNVAINRIPESIVGLSLQGRFDKAIYNLIGRFRQIKYFSVSAKIEYIDFGNFDKIEHYQGPWSKLTPDILSNIKSLVSYDVPGDSETANVFSLMKSIEHLEIMNGMFRGVEFLTLVRPRVIKFSHCKSLDNIDPLGNSADLKELELQKCKNLFISSNLISNMINLEKLVMFDIGGIDNLEFIGRLHRLRVLTFPNTPLGSIDLSPVVRSNSLEHFWTRPNRNYEPPLRDVMAKINIANTST